MFVITKVVEISTDRGIYNELRGLIYIFYYALLLGLSWLVFTVIYIFMPNKKVPWDAALVAGFFSGVLFQIVQWSYIHLQIYLTSYNAIYGSFAAIPLFLIWLQLSWLITLIGGEISFQYANAKYFFRQEKTEEASEDELALLVCLSCAESFKRGSFPTTLEKVSEENKIPLATLQVVTEKLVNEGLLFKIPGEHEKFFYQPSKPLKDILLSDISGAMVETSSGAGLSAFLKS